MKKSCLLITLATIFSLGLVGCKSNKTSSTEIVTSSEPVEPVESSEVETIIESSETETSESEVESEEPIPEVKTAESVSTDINTIFNGLVGADIMSWYEDYNCYIGGLNLGAAKATTDEEHQAELKSATEFVAGYLPEYLTTEVSTYETTEDDYYIGLSVDEVGVDLFGYLNSDNNVIVQIQVSNIVK